MLEFVLHIDCSVFSCKYVLNCPKYLVRSLSISSRITSGPEDEVAKRLQLAQPEGPGNFADCSNLIRQELCNV